MVSCLAMSLQLTVSVCSPPWPQTSDTERDVQHRIGFNLITGKLFRNAAGRHLSWGKLMVDHSEAH